MKKFTALLMIAGLATTTASALTVQGVTINDSGETPLWELLDMNSDDMAGVTLLGNGIFNAHYRVEVLEILAGNTQGLGYYTDLGAGANRVMVDDTVAKGDMLDFAPGVEFGFFLHTRPSGGDNLWYSQAILNANGVNDGNMMLLFRDASNRIIMAWEDLPTGKSDKDYNDFVAVLKLAPSTPPVPSSSIPEPASLTLLALGAAGIALRKRFTA